MPYTGDKTDVTALVNYAQRLEGENERLRAGLNRAADFLETGFKNHLNPAEFASALETIGDTLDPERTKED